MPQKLVIDVKQEEPYVLNESNDSEVIFSLHIPFKVRSEFIDD